MSDFLHFFYWFVCVFISALCVAELTGGYWHFQSAAMSLLLPLCLSFMLGSFFFLGILNLRVRWRLYASRMQSNSIARISEADRVATRNANLRPSRLALD